MSRQKQVRGWVAGLSFLIYASIGHAQLDSRCGELANGYGPFDYRTDKHRLGVVERHHFTRNVEMLKRGNTSAWPGADLDYTLRAFPNHHRALMSMLGLVAKEKTHKPRGAGFDAECYFARAERFRPDDGMVKMIYGLFLMRDGKQEAAVRKLEQAKASQEDNANFHYNLGLAYFEVKDYDKALESAHRAYAMNFPLPGLRDKLARVGRWRAPAGAVKAKAE
jgi:tetratricopeptide (TPR) repeat protein